MFPLRGGGEEEGDGTSRSRADELWPPAVLNLQPVWSGGRHMRLLFVLYSSYLRQGKQNKL